MGNTSPTHAAPPHSSGGGCGIFGQIILAIVAVVVTVLTAGVMAPVAGQSVFAAGLTALSGAGASVGGFATAMVAGAVGSTVSQGIGLATGLQDKFSWAGVAMSAIGAGVGYGVGALAEGTWLAGSTFGAGMARGILGNVATQGIAVATGLQKKFDWAGVAAAGVGGGVSSLVGGAIQGTSFFDNATLDYGAHLLISGMAGDIANAATRSLINGSDFGDNIIRALPDTIGQTIGNMVAGGISGSGSQPTGNEPVASGPPRQLQPWLSNGNSPNGAQGSSSGAYFIDAGPAIPDSEANAESTFEHVDGMDVVTITAPKWVPAPQPLYIIVYSNTNKTEASNSDWDQASHFVDHVIRVATNTSKRISTAGKQILNTVFDEFADGYVWTVNHVGAPVARLFGLNPKASDLDKIANTPLRAMAKGGRVVKKQMDDPSLLLTLSIDAAGIAFATGETLAGGVFGGVATTVVSLSETGSVTKEDVAKGIWNGMTTGASGSFFGKEAVFSRSSAEAYGAYNAARAQQLGKGEAATVAGVTFVAGYTFGAARKLAVVKSNSNDWGDKAADFAASGLIRIFKSATVKTIYRDGNALLLGAGNAFDKLLMIGAPDVK